MNDIDIYDNYQWSLNGVDLAGETEAIYSTDQAGNYEVDVSNNDNTCAYDAAVTIVESSFDAPKPILRVCTEPDIRLSVIAQFTLSSNGPFICAEVASYEWFRDGNLITGATSDAWIVTEPGWHEVIVTDIYGCQNMVGINVDQEAINGDDVVISTSSSEIWAENRVINSMVYIEEMALLEISGGAMLYFGADKGIVVNQAGKLILDNAYLTHNCGISLQGGGDWGLDYDIVGQWEGIKVIGNKFQEHPISLDAYPATNTDHGVVQIIKETTIESAKIGINASDTGEFTTGGIVAVGDELFGIEQYNYFRNNATDIIIDYTDASIYNNISIIYSNYFENTTATYSIFLNSVNGIDVAHNRFEEDVSDNFNFDFHFAKYRRGIYARACPNAQIRNNQFREMSMGVVYDAFDLDCAYSFSTFSNNTFRDMLRALYIQGGQFYNITGNFFDLQHNLPIGSEPFDRYGLFLAAAGNFTVSDNIFDSSIITSENYLESAAYGLIVADSEFPGTVTDNTFEYGDFGISLQGDNSNLKIRCNLFGNFTVSSKFQDVAALVVTDGTIGIQGVCDDVNTPAGNEWHTSSSYDCINDPFKVLSPEVNFAYRAHEGDLNEDPTTVPECVSPDIWFSNVQICEGIYKTEESCELFGLKANAEDNLSEYLAEANQEIVNYSTKRISIENDISALKTIEDDNKTTEFIGDIQDFSLTETDLQTELEQASIHSELIQTELIDRTVPLSSATLKDLLVPNTPLSSEVVKSLDERPTPITSTAMDEIKSAQSSPPISPNIVHLQRNLAYVNQRIQQLETAKLLALLKAEDITGLEAELASSNSLSARKLMMNHHLANDDYTNSRNVLQLIDNESTTAANDQYVALMNVSIDLKEAGLSYSNMTPTQLATVQAVALANVPASIHAEAILHGLNNEVYHHPINKIDVTAAKMRRKGNWSGNYQDLKGNALEVYPNPAQDFVQIQTNLGTAQGILYIYNSQGQLMTQLPVTKTNQVVELNLKDWTVGIYLYELVSNNESIAQGKFIVQP